MNVENAAGGFGVTPQIADELFELGADVMTTGNHVWDKRELLDYLASVPADSHARARRILRPANMQPGLPGYGVYEGTIADGPNKGLPYAVLNLMGKVFMSGTNDPFHAANDLLSRIKAKSHRGRFSRRSHQRKSRHGLAPGRQSDRRSWYPHAHPHRG
jgi:calcineurin-like phosphoesterase